MRERNRAVRREDMVRDKVRRNTLPRGDSPRRSALLAQVRLREREEDED